MMYYRIKFKAAPQELVFEALRHFVFVRDLIQTVRHNFKISQADLQVYDERGNRLQETDSVDNGRTYIIKRVPSVRVVVRRKIKLYR